MHNVRCELFRPALALFLFCAGCLSAIDTDAQENDEQTARFKTPSTDDVLVSRSVNQETNCTRVCQGNTCFWNTSNNHVLSHVKVVSVLWGTNVNIDVRDTLVGFYTDILNSPYMDWLSEDYSTPADTIGRGTFLGQFQITPHNQSLDLQESDLSGELSYQISQGYLPTNDSNTLYQILMPVNVTVHTSNDPDGIVNPGDCGGYHWYSGANLIYSAIYDAPGCDQNNQSNVHLGGIGGTFLTRTSSHELVEAITDPYANAWHDTCGNEVSDDCTSGSFFKKFEVPALADRSYAVASSWSNSQGGCIAQKTFRSADLMMRNSSWNYVWKVPNGNYYAASGYYQPDNYWVIQGLADINADSITDIIWRGGGGELVIWFMNNGNEILNGSGVHGSADWSWVIRAIADVDGDGVSDIIWENVNTAEIYLWQLGYTGDAVFYASLGYDGGYTFRGTGDFNHDGIADLLFTTISGNQHHLSVWLMDRTVGAYMSWGVNPITLPTGGEATISDAYSFKGIGDFNGDGTSDIAWQNNTTNMITVWNFDTACSNTTNPICVIGSKNVGTAPVNYTIRAVGNADPGPVGNGTSDLFLHNASTGSVLTWLISPTETATQVNTGGASTDYVIKGAGFFNFIPSVW